MSGWRHLGKGLGFPVVPDRERRELPMVEGPAKVAQSILLILETEPGERLMRPDFGAGLRRYLMRPNTAATRALIRREVETALSLWEPRIELRRVEVTAGDDPALVLIAIDYLHKRDRSPANLVFPFYLE
ncbi:MAG TPA: GPW/gp25 family protein [Enhygromyxa sp.]|nr:GPW/gp25 family protein [Enhygromyxa sp.]